MRKKFFILLSLIILLVVFVFVLSSKKQTIPTATIDGVKFNLDIARTQSQQEKGLAIYNSLPKNKGMLFPFPKPDYYAFWMKDMKFPIDIIYIRQSRIVTIFSDVLNPASPSAPLPILRPNAPSDTVLEINAGLSNKYGFKKGDFVQLNY